MASNSRFYKLISYGKAYIYDEVKMDYFAVSYQDLLIFKEDFIKKLNVMILLRIHFWYNKKKKVLGAVIGKYKELLRKDF